MPDTVRVEWESLKAAKAKLRKITREAEALTDPTERANMTHTAYKLGSFLNDGLYGLLAALGDIDVDTTQDGGSRL
jgi:hypothetical protein